MSFDWYHFLVLAREITQSPIEDHAEARCRIAISRAYYALFGTVRELENFKQRGNRKGGAHLLLRKHLLEQEDKQRRQLAVNLERLHEWRKQADYDRDFNDPQNTLEMALLTVDSAFELVRQIYETK